MPLKKTDDIGDWIKDFYKSDASQFDGASKEKRRKMAVAAYLSAQEAIQSVFENDEYDAEGKMSKSQLKTMIDAAQQLHDMLADDTNMPEWVQSKITKATDYIDTARDYMQSELDAGDGPIGENKNEKSDGAYMKGVARKDQDDRKAHFAKYGKKDDDKDSSYKPAPGDKDPKTGELKKTKLSKHTKKYNQMYGEENDQIEEKIEGLTKKSEKSGISYGILKKVYDRGMAAWKTGHRPGTSPQQWAFARVNSFITKGKGTWGKADKDLAAKVRKEQTNLRQLANELEEKKKAGLWANVHAKRKRGEAPAKPGDKDYPEKLPEESVEERKSTVPELMQVNIAGEGGVTVKAKDEKEALKIALKKMKIQSRFANDKKFMAKVQIIPAESYVNEGVPVYENKLKNMTIQFADEMQELVKLIKDRKSRIAVEKMAKTVENGNLKGAGAIFQNLDSNTKALVAGAFTSLFGDRVAKQYGITEDTTDYANYISKTLYK